MTGEPLTRRGAIALAFLQGCRAICKPSKTVVGFSQMETINPWRIAETNSMREEAARRRAKVDIVVTDAQGQTAKQVSDVEDLVARRVSAIFLAPCEFEGLAPALDSARELKIPCSSSIAKRPERRARIMFASSVPTSCSKPGALPIG